ncbi:hypothetical protein [Nonomuraea cavernae]|uniref:Abortive infection protein n=1 Tax=Nonomuraea cavernae TaxID=2045107 RepID=A0A918DNA6_9ACTN|nr:hypothetical protein [Nonomuraea cavernae]MCA2186969.1 hypothetical protein [Nonomuraea cavernae]GGO75149.1 hypothetical protein GCM10012289_49510 [Nonomuraea cavernae]
MRAYGVTYDTGFPSAGTTTHEPFDPGVVRREMRIIREELHCDAVRVTGGDPDRLATAAGHAARAGLEVWYSPFTNGLTRDELMAFIVDGAERAERLRAEGAHVIFLTGSEISLFTGGFLPGDSLEERLGVIAEPARVRAALPELRVRVHDFLTRAVTAVRERFGGPVSYASLPFEGVDWALFDIIATDAGYRDAATEHSFRESLRAQTSQGKPFAVTEFGCATHRGAAALGGRGDSIVEWDEHARPARLTTTVTRDEEEQARYVRELLDIYDEEGTDTAFVNTFARRDLPTSSEPGQDFDTASFGIVKVLQPGRTGTAYPGLPWEPKAAFHTLAEFGRARAAETEERTMA